MPNPKNPKFVGVTGTLTGIRAEGTLKKFYVDIASVTFLGPVPQVHATKGKYFNPDPYPTHWTDLFLSADPDPEWKAKGSNQL